MSPDGFHLLVIDDDALIVDSLRLLLPSNWTMWSSKNGEDWNRKVPYHAAFVDMHLTATSTKAEGPGVIRNLLELQPRLEVIAMSGDLSMSLMEEVLHAGARQFLAKPLIPDEIISTLEKIEALWKIRHLESRGNHSSSSLFIGRSEAAEKTRKKIASLRGEAAPILLEGETGTGKEVLARLLNMQESTRPFIAVNVSAISENLFESEMFGHVKGAFTGADALKIGLAEAAHGGDLFLDEVEALTLAQQVKLLRFLESGEIRKVGAKESQHVKVRLILATNRNLEQLVSEQKFREDLLYRINGHKILLPPLRERTEDIESLSEHFLHALRPRLNKSLSPEALENLKNYDWPGNIRELKRVCEQVALTSQLPIIRSQDVHSLLLSRNSNAPEQTANTVLDYRMGMAKLVENFEAQVIQDILKTTKDVDMAAQILQVSRSNLYKKIKEYQIEVKS